MQWMMFPKEQQNNFAQAVADSSVLNRNASALKASDGLHRGSPGGSDGTESACDAGDQVFTMD